MDLLSRRTVGMAQAYGIPLPYCVWAEVSIFRTRLVSYRLAAPRLCDSHLSFLADMDGVWLRLRIEQSSFSLSSEGGDVGQQSSDADRVRLVLQRCRPKKKRVQSRTVQKISLKERSKPTQSRMNFIIWKRYRHTTLGKRHFRHDSKATKSIMTQDKSTEQNSER